MRHTTTVTLSCQHADCWDVLQLTAKTLREGVRSIDLDCALREAALWLDWRYDIATDKVYCGLHAKDLCCSRCLVRRDDCYCMGGPEWSATSAVKPDDERDAVTVTPEQLIDDPIYKTLGPEALKGIVSDSLYEKISTSAVTPVEAYTTGRAIPICRRCSECVGQNHHWIENHSDGEYDDYFVCKHCEATCPEKDSYEGFPEPDERRIHYPEASR